MSPLIKSEPVHFNETMRIFESQLTRQGGEANVTHVCYDSRHQESRMQLATTDFIPANEALGDGVELRRRAAADGYLFFSGLIDVESIRCLRGQVAEICERHGWIKAGSNPSDCIAEPSRACAEPEPDFYEIYRDIYKLEAFHSMAHSTEIIDVIKCLVGDPVLVHPTNIARVVFPAESVAATPSHQDFIHIQGDPETFTCWIPLGDCPREHGGLVALRGSHKAGIYDHHVTRGAGFLGVPDDELTGDWLSVDYEIGDALIFHSHAVHRALPNTTERLRLSVDYRYQSAREPIVGAFLDPHVANMGWEEVYAGWESSDLQYYWRNFDVETVVRDSRFYDKRDAEALDLARQGNDVARPVLTRMIEREPDPAKRQVFEEALAQLNFAIAARASDN